MAAKEEKMSTGGPAPGDQNLSSNKSVSIIENNDEFKPLKKPDLMFNKLKQEILEMRERKPEAIVSE